MQRSEELKRRLKLKGGREVEKVCFLEKKEGLFSDL